MIDYKDIDSNLIKNAKNFDFVINKKPSGMYVNLEYYNGLWCLRKKNKNEIISEIDYFLYPALRSFYNLISNSQDFRDFLNLKSIVIGNFSFCVNLENHDIIGFDNNCPIGGIKIDESIFKGVVDFDNLEAFLEDKNIDKEDLFFHSKALSFKYNVKPSKTEHFTDRAMLLFLNSFIDDLKEPILMSRSTYHSNLLANLSLAFDRLYDECYKNFDPTNCLFESFIEFDDKWCGYLEYNLQKRILSSGNLNMLYQFKFITCLFNKKTVPNNVFSSSENVEKYINFQNKCYIPLKPRYF